MADLREFKVGILSGQVRDLRVLGILLKQLKSASYRFVQTEHLADGGVDIAIVDDSDVAMRELAEAAGLKRPSMVCIHLMPAATAQSSRFELVPGQMMSHLMPLLDRAAARLQRGPSTWTCRCQPTSTPTCWSACSTNCRCTPGHDPNWLNAWRWAAR